MCKQTNNSIDVSVIVPCYNTEKYLEQCLASIQKNDRINIEVIVVNDGSTDDSLAIMRKFEASDDRFFVIDKPNEGYGASVNKGIAHACGKYIAIVEPDDYLKPHMYDDLFELASQFGDAPDIVKSSYWRIWMPDTQQEKQYHCSYYKRYKVTKQPFTLRDNPWLISAHPSIWSALYRRDFLNTNHIRFREVAGAGWVDNPFLIETMVQAKRIIYTDTPYYCYREDLPNSSSSTRNLSLPLERWNDMYTILKKLHVEDEGIWANFYKIGFRYMTGCMHDGALSDEHLSAEIARLYGLMSEDILVKCNFISPKNRRFAFEISSRQAPHMSVFPYLKSLVAEFFYCWRTNGFVFAMSRVRLFLQRFKKDNALQDPTKTRSASI